MLCDSSRRANSRLCEQGLFCIVGGRRGHMLSAGGGGCRCGLGREVVQAKKVQDEEPGGARKARDVAEGGCGQRLAIVVPGHGRRLHPAAAARHRRDDENEKRVHNEDESENPPDDGLRAGRRKGEVRVAAAGGQRMHVCASDVECQHIYLTIGRQNEGAQRVGEAERWSAYMPLP